MGELANAYRNTTCDVETEFERIRLRIGESTDTLARLLREHDVTHWAFVTACNRQVADR